MGQSRKSKGLRSRTRKQHGGTRYEDRPASIPNAVYRANRDEEQYYYDVECVHTKVSKEVGDERRRVAMAAAAEAAAAQERRAATIATDPDVEITAREYEALPREQRGQWKVSRSEGPQWNTTVYYKRVRRENSLEWRAEHDPAVRLEEHQFRSLPARLQALFKATSVQSGMQEYTTYYVRKAAGNDERALRATPEWRAEHDPAVRLDEYQFRALPARLQALLKPISVQSGMQDYTTYYVRKAAGNDERALRATPEWRAEHDPAVRLDDRAYRALPARLRDLGWVEESVQSGMQEWSSQWRRRTAANNARNARRRLESTLEWKVDNDVHIELTDAQYESLIPRQRALGWNKQNVQIDRYEWAERWVRNSVRPPVAAAAAAAAAPRAAPPVVRARSLGSRFMNMVRGRRPPGANEDPM
jgi:hypothetical protein